MKPPDRPRLARRIVRYLAKPKSTKQVFASMYALTWAPGPYQREEIEDVLRRLMKAGVIHYSAERWWLRNYSEFREHEYQYGYERPLKTPTAKAEE